MKPEKVLIRKYENRRLYDATNSRYVNLDEIAGMLRKGMEVQAVDAATGNDITRLVLTQIIVEGAKDHDSGFPLDILRQMVMATGRASQEGLLLSIQALLELYQSAYRGFSQAMPPLDWMRMMTPQHRDPPGELDRLQRRIEELERAVSESSPKRRKRRSGTARQS